MSSTAKICAALSAVAFIAACAPRQQEEVVYVDPAPVAAEPTYNKY
ncbi:hypothetical protein [Roseitranquillus sediminis]|nr:hypothetical protein [Roseitranquillus sediminis]MBM9594161.1 hypothetical protein [Roseitranquillus sediminis]